MTTWMSQYREAEQLGHEIMELINERNSLKRTGSNTARVQSTIRVKIQQYSGQLKSLKDLLLRDSSSYNVTQQELQRRQNQLDILVSKEQQLNQAFKPTQSNFDRANLFDERFGDDSTEPWGRPSSDNNLDVAAVTPAYFRQQQQQVIQEQDKGLDALHQVIQRQKMMGKAIGDEIDQQNILIDDITDGMEKVNRKVEKTEKHVKKVTKKTGSCIMIIIVILLLIAIVVVAVWK